MPVITQYLKVYGETPLGSVSGENPLRDSGNVLAGVRLAGDEKRAASVLLMAPQKLLQCNAAPPQKRKRKTKRKGREQIGSELGLTVCPGGCLEDRNLSCMPYC